MARHRGFTLIELLVVIAVIAVLMAILLPSLQAAKRLAASSNCLANQRTLMTAWIMYADDNDGWLVSNLACYDDDKGRDKTAWVFSPKDIHGNSFAHHPAPPTVTDADRFRGIQAGALWQYIKDLGAYHCPGDNRRSTQQPPRDCWRSYSISYAFGYIPLDQYKGKTYQKMQEVKNGGLYYVFVEEEHNGSNYGENEGGWALRGVGNPMDDSGWSYSDQQGESRGPFRHGDPFPRQPRPALVGQALLVQGTWAAVVESIWIWSAGDRIRYARANNAKSMVWG
ncbi:MAG: type II secretion system protein [Planctomycetota bacterium]|jgi:prepilin-type N-terminal cleavage/methylation domain-containing protein